MATEANDMVIITNANAVSLKKGTGEKTLFKLSNTVTSVGQGSFSTGLNAISIGSNGEGSGIIPFDEATEGVDGKLVINTIRRSGTGGSAPASNYVMMYNPDTQPNEATYSSDIPQQINNLEADVNTLQTDVNTLQTNLSGSTFAIGAGSSATGTNSMAIGNNATTSTYDNAIAIGNGTACSVGNQIKIGNSSSAYQMDGRLNLVNSTSSSLISYGNAVKMYRNENGLTIGNYGAFAVQVADTTTEPTSVPATRAGINGFFLNDEGRAYLGNSANTKSVALRSANGEVYMTGYTTAGNVSTIGTSGQLSVSSDRRLKENIIPYNEPSLTKIMKLKPSYYNWIEGTDKRKELGFIAQDVETIIPEAVDGKKYEYEWEKDEHGEPILDVSGNIRLTDTPRYRGLCDRPVIAVLVKAIQEQQEIIETEKTKVVTLESQVADLLSRVNVLENPP